MLALFWSVGCGGSAVVPDPTTPPPPSGSSPWLGRGLLADDGLWLVAADPSGSGGLYRFDSPVGPRTLADATAVLAADGLDQIGTSLASCDADADGRPEIVLGAPGVEGGGGAWLLFDPLQGGSLSGSAFIEGSRDPLARAGAVVACGDIGGGPEAEIAWSAPDALGLGSAVGAGSVGFHRWQGDAAVKIGNVDTSYSGSHLGALIVGRDLDGDGSGDVVVGGPGADRIHLWFDEIAGTIDVGNATTLQGTEGEALGSSLATGDVNGDGAVDLVAGIPDAYGQTGGVLVIDGPFGPGDDGLLSNLDRPHDRHRGVETGDRAGFSIAVVGDVDADGRDDLLVGAPFAGGFGPEAGAAYLVLGNLGGNLDSAAALFLGEVEGGRLGYAVAGGDVDGDSVIDLFVSAPDAFGLGSTYRFAGTDRGVVYPAGAVGRIDP